MSCMLSRQSWFRKWSPAIILLKNPGDTAAPSTHWPHTWRTATRRTCSNVGPCATVSAGLITQFCHARVGNSLQQAASKKWSHSRGLFKKGTCPTDSTWNQGRESQHLSLVPPSPPPSSTDCRLYSCAFLSYRCFSGHN